MPSFPCAIRTGRGAVVAVAAVVLCALGEPRAGCQFETPLQQYPGAIAGAYLACDDNAGVSALGWLQSDPLGTHTGLVPIACEQAGTICAGGGILGDGMVTIEADWSHPGMSGCPPSPVPERVGVVVQASDGAGLIILLTRDRLDSGYLVLGAQLYIPETAEVAPLACGPGAGRPEVLGASPGPPGQIEVTLRFPEPVVHSDCDPGSLASVFAGPCAEPPVGPPARGPLYVRTGPCTTRPDLRRGLWTATGVLPDSQGEAVITTAEASPGGCLYIGGTTYIEGVQSGAITGYATIPGGPCADGDGDGVTGCGGDCDDADAARAPDHSESCDLLDNDCDGRIDEGLDCPATCAAMVKNGGDVRVTYEPGSSIGPVIVYTGAGYGLAWTDDRDGGYGVYFARLGPSGARLGPDLRLGIPGLPASSPSMVWNGDAFGIAWLDRRQGQPEIHFARIAADGSILTAPASITPGAFAGPPGLVATDEGFAVAYTVDYDLIGGNDIFFRSLDATGMPTGNERQVTSTPEVESGPALAWNGTNFAIAWTADRDATGRPEVYAGLLDQDGLPLGGDARLSTAPESAGTVVLVAAADGFGAAWMDQRSGHTEVYAAGIDSAGRPLSEVQVSRHDAVPSSWPALVWSGAEFRIAWQEGGDIHLAVLDTLGVRAGAELTFTNHFSHTSSVPSVTVAGSGLGVAWADGRDGNAEIYMARLGCHCVDGDDDGYTACVECDDARPEINPGSLDVCNGADDDCNAFIDDDAEGHDSDSDSVPNACDNCRLAANTDQADLDVDGAGDLCDLSDGLIMIMMRDAVIVEWQMEAAFASFNLYRGDIPGLVDPDGDGAALHYGDCLATGLAGPAYGDPMIPPPGSAFLYIVTGRGIAGENGFGVASSGALRPNTAPCP